jgi:hypothetical protein
MAIKQKIILVLALILGVIIQIIPVERSGLNYSYGIGFWGANGHDSVWHLSLINHITNPFKIQMPIFSGTYLQNYHPFFDILISFFVRITHFSSSIWLFQIFPILSAFLLLYLSFLFGRLITKKFSGGIIFLALNTLAGSFGWIYTLFKFGNFSGESIFWAMQSPSNQINPPYNLSLIFILIVLIILYKHPHFDKLSLKESLIIVFILLLSPVTKAYSAVVVFSFFGLYSLFTFFKHHSINNLFTFTLSLILAIILFRIYNPNSAGLLIYQPFWFVNSMIESPDRIFIPYLANMRYTLEAAGKMGPRYLVLMLSTLGLFVVGNFGWRLLGFIKSFHPLNFFKSVIIFNIVILTLIPTLFIQKGTSWNTIQFLYYALFLANILLTIYLSSILNKKYGSLLIGVIFLTYFLSFLGTLPNYLGKNPPAAISLAEQQALTFLSSQPQGTVLTVPYDAYLKQNFKSTPLPLYAYETTAYVSAYSHQITYLEDEMNLQNSGFDVVTRRKASLDFFAGKNVYEDRGFLVNNQIDYIYIAGIQKNTLHLDITNLYLQKIFENSDSLIYRVQR